VEDVEHRETAINSSSNIRNVGKHTPYTHTHKKFSNVFCLNFEKYNETLTEL
jgi:hypothetical protein